MFVIPVYVPVAQCAAATKVHTADVFELVRVLRCGCGCVFEDAFHS